MVLKHTDVIVAQSYLVSDLGDSISSVQGWSDILISLHESLELNIEVSVLSL